MAIELLLALTLIAQNQTGSAFNAYAAHLDAKTLPAACRFDAPSYFGNLAYPFRAEAYPGRRVLKFKDGVFDEMGPSRSAEWSTRIERQERVALGVEPAVLIVFFADHVGGSGSASHAMVLRCNKEHLEIVFEAGGEGVRVSYSGTGDVEISHPVWQRRDSHASPSRLIHEYYHWNRAGGRFVLARSNVAVVRKRAGVRANTRLHPTAAGSAAPRRRVNRGR